MSNGLLWFQGRLVVGDNNQLRTQILQSLHDSPLGGHSGISSTYHKVKQLFYWPKLEQAVVDNVLACDICQHCKHEHVAAPGLLQPLKILEQAWMSLSMNFIEGLLILEGKDVILLVVDRFTEFAPFSSFYYPRSSQNFYGFSTQIAWNFTLYCV